MNQKSILSEQSTISPWSWIKSERFAKVCTCINQNVEKEERFGHIVIFSLYNHILNRLRSIHVLNLMSLDYLTDNDAFHELVVKTKLTWAGLVTNLCHASARAGDDGRIPAANGCSKQLPNLRCITDDEITPRDKSPLKDSPNIRCGSDVGKTLTCNDWLNQQVGVFPTLVSHLILDYHSTQPLVLADIPSSMTQLTSGDCFKHHQLSDPLHTPWTYHIGFSFQSIGVFPSSMTHLAFCNHFNQCPPSNHRCCKAWPSFKSDSTKNCDMWSRNLFGYVMCQWKLWNHRNVVTFNNTIRSMHGSFNGIFDEMFVRWILEIIRVHLSICYVWFKGPNDNTTLAPIQTRTRRWSVDHSVINNW